MGYAIIKPGSQHLLTAISIAENTPVAKKTDVVDRNRMNSEMILRMNSQMTR